MIRSRVSQLYRHMEARDGSLAQDRHPPQFQASYVNIQEHARMQNHASLKQEEWQFRESSDGQFPSSIIVHGKEDLQLMIRERYSFIS